MAVTLNSTGITFSNGQSMNSVPSAGTTLSGVQYGPFQRVQDGNPFFQPNPYPWLPGGSPGITVYSNPQNLPPAPYNATTTVQCGAMAYIVNGQLDDTINAADGRLVFSRVLYRTVS